MKLEFITIMNSTGRGNCFWAPSSGPRGLSVLPWRCRLLRCGVQVPPDSGCAALLCFTLTKQTQEGPLQWRPLMIMTMYTLFISHSCVSNHDLALARTSQDEGDSNLLGEVCGMLSVPQRALGITPECLKPLGGVFLATFCFPEKSGSH